MRNFIAIVSVLLSAGGLAYAENPIKMVTYFPVPYASYNRVDVGGNANAQLDIGLLSGSSQLTLGNSSISNSAGLDVKNGTNLDAGTVSIDATTFSITGSNGINFPQYASGSDATPQLKLKTADIGNFYGNTLKAPNVSAPKMMLFDKTFPAGNSTGMTNDKICKESLKWKKLKLGKGNTEALYLMCGEEKECTPGTEESRNCGCKNEGTQKKTCGSDGKWGNWSTCTKPADCPKEYHWVHGYGAYENLNTQDIGLTGSSLYGMYSTYQGVRDAVITRMGSCDCCQSTGYWWEHMKGNCPSDIKDGLACTPSYPGAHDECYVCVVHGAGNSCPKSGECAYIVDAPMNSDFSSWLQSSSRPGYPYITVKLYKHHWFCEEKH